MKMQTYTLLFGLILFVATVSGRHAYEEESESEQNADERADLADNVRRLRKHNPSLMRHRRRAWQNNNMNMNPMYPYPGYGYDYNVPQNPFYPDYRNDQNNQDLIPQIYRLLDEISAYMKRPQLPPPPPQPIYVPYAVPYPVQAQCKCKGEKDTKPDIGNRFGGMEDDNQNWGLVPDAANDDENDGNRPISFVPIMPKQKPKRKQVNVEHGSSQAGAAASVQIPAIPAAVGQEGRVPSQNAAKIPGMCDVFSLSCCNGSPQQQKQCFINVGCSSTYDDGRGCNKDRLLTVIDAYSKAYSPVN